MKKEEIKYPGIEETLFKILQADSAKEMGQGNFVILLSLVNLMGLVNLVSARAGVKAPAGANQAAQGNSSVAGGNGVSETDTPVVRESRAVSFDQAAALQGLVKRIITPGAGQPQKNDSETNKPDEQKSDK